MWAVEEVRQHVSRQQHHTGQFYQVIKLSTTIITLVEVSIAYAEDWKNRDFYPSYHDWLGAHKTERERETETERDGVHNKSE